MTRDIVERLKETAIMLPRIGYVSVGHEATEAADEITALRARLEAVEKERDECMDSLEAALDQRDTADARAERAEAALAQLEPRDGERWVTPDMIQYQYEWMEWLAGDQPLVPIDDLRAVQAALATARRDALEEAAVAADCGCLPDRSDCLSTQKHVPICYRDGCADIRALAGEAET